MNKANKYFKRGLLIFILLTVSIIATLLFRDTVLFYIFVVTAIVLALGTLLVLMQTKKEIENLLDDVSRLRQRERANMDKNQVKTDNVFTEIFKIDESLARILPSQDTHFDNVNHFCEKVLQNIAKELGIVQGLVFVLDDIGQNFDVSGEYAYYSEERPRSFTLGETISGQVAKNQEMLNLKEIPEGYVTVLSGLGKSAPPHLLIAPVVYQENSIGVIELASFKPFGKNEEALAEKICETMAVRLNDLRTY